MTTGRSEDYLEAIYTVSKKKGYAKVRDISTILGVGPPSVTEMFKKLSDDGYINYEKYSGVTLTDKGREIAEATRLKHDTLKELLMILGINEDIAEEDACKIEHTVHPDTMENLSKFVEFVKGAEEESHWLAHFRHYLKTGERIQCRPSKGHDCPIHKKEKE
ncbi:MAG: metal-dependent transcriptional regulator [Thermoplasmata archaeon]|nr:metal-dependent transcriptional regulator [Thermoplasmata archaeon]